MFMFKLSLGEGSVKAWDNLMLFFSVASHMVSCNSNNISCVKLYLGFLLLWLKIPQLIRLSALLILYFFDIKNQQMFVQTNTASNMKIN